MSIKVKCPNGHVLNVKNRFAGKSGRCPFCQATVSVPKPSLVIDDDALAKLDMAKAAQTDPGNSDQSVVDEPPAVDSGVDLGSSSALMRKKMCPGCDSLVSSTLVHCPRCGALLKGKRPPGSGQFW
jgi:hypothetical protein